MADKIKEAWRDDEVVKESIRATVRFPAMCNAGGAIATISVIGATAHDGKIINVLAVPLSLFLLGLFLTLIAAARLLYTVTTGIKGEAPKLEPGWGWFLKVIESRKDTLHLLPIALFFFGCLSGVAIIVWA